MLVIGIVLAVVLLPSVLNLPQANPTDIAEYAPVPPNNSAAPPGGNLNSLGLAGSQSLQESVTNGGLSGGESAPEYGSVPQALRCVIIAGEAHQTEDPLSPPCVGYYNGNNGGATAPGVSASEVRVLIYMEGGDGGKSSQTGDSCGFSSLETEARPNDEEFDLDKPPSSSAVDPGAQGHYQEVGSDYVPAIRDLDRYFNGHYQLYNRHVHMVVWFAHKPRESGVACPTASDRQADCNEEFNAFHPFAVLAATWGNASPYVNCMAQHGVANFLAMNAAIVEPQIGFPSSFYQSYPGYVWSYVPTTEQYAQWEANWLCQKVIHPNGGSEIGQVTNSGDPKISGTRVFGFIRANDPNTPTLNRFGLLVENDVKNCGATIKDEEQIPVAGFDIEAPPTEDSSTSNTEYAKQAMLKFQLDHVTTVLWGGGSDYETTRDADSEGYYPEWFIAGDRHLEGNTNAAVEDAKEWQHVTAVTTVERYPNQYSQQCYTAYADTDPNAQPPLGEYAQYACAYYPDLRLMFTGFQIAGPRLTVQNMDQGFHNIPKIELNNPYVPTCYFDPGNYTCIKDMAYEWYDAGGTTPDNQKGCWRMIHDGQRYLEGNFPSGDIYGGSPPEATTQNVCNDYAGG
ncbi:MAG TPA: hypothetical protein VF137_10465 [Candidatus Dormibacteraeota bacterium]